MRKKAHGNRQERAGRGWEVIGICRSMQFSSGIGYGQRRKTMGFLQQPEKIGRKPV